MDELNAIYEEIKKLIIDNSDFDWEQFAMHSVQDEAHSSFDMDYKTNEEWVDLSALRTNGAVSDDKELAIELGLFNCVKKLLNLAKNGTTPKWNNVVFSLKKSGEYKAVYYALETDITRMRDEQDRVVYRYKYLNIMPTEANMKFIEGVEQELL